MTAVATAPEPVYSFLGHQLPVHLAARLSDKMPLLDERDSTIIVRRRTERLVPAKTPTMPAAVALALIEEAPDPETAAQYAIEARAAGATRSDVRRACHAASQQWRVAQNYRQTAP
jgi:hypothetical protein